MNYFLEDDLNTDFEHIDENKLKEEIEKTAAKQFEELKKAYSSIKIQTNRKYIEKVTEELKREVEKYKKTKDLKSVESSVKKFIQKMIGSNHKVLVKLEKTKMPNAAIWHSALATARYSDKMEIIVFITTGLLNLLESDEIVAVLLHELGHFYYVSKRIKKLNDSKFITYLVILVITFILAKKIERTEDKTQKVKLAYIILALFFLMIVMVTILSYNITKEHERGERISDSYAAYCGYGIELKSAFEKFYPSLVKKRNEKKIKVRKILIKLAVFFRRLTGEEHESAHVRICKALAITLKDPEIKGTQLEQRLKLEYQEYHCSKLLSYI